MLCGNESWAEERHFPDLKYPLLVGVDLTVEKSVLSFSLSECGDLLTNDKISPLQLLTAYSFYVK